MDKITSFFNYISSEFYKYFLKKKYKAVINKGVFFNGLPNVYIKKGCSLIIGENL